MDWRKTAERARQLLAHAEREGNAIEAGVAERKLEQLLAGIDLELLETLAGQRATLEANWQERQSRIWVTNGRPNADTREMLERAIVLLRHWESIDVLPSVVRLERMRAARGR